MYSDVRTLWVMIDNCTATLKKEPEFASVVLNPTDVRGGSKDPLDHVWDAEMRLVELFFRIRNAASIWSEICSSVTDIGRGTEQQESTMILGRPVMMLRVRSSEYKDHQVRTKVSRFATVAEGSSLRTWSPSVYAKRRAIPMIVHALSIRQYFYLRAPEVGSGLHTG